MLSLVRVGHYDTLLYRKASRRMPCLVYLYRRFAPPGFAHARSSLCPTSKLPKVKFAHHGVARCNARRVNMT